MPLIDHIDGPNRDIYLHADTVGASIHPIDIYKEMRALRRTTEALRPYDVFLTAKGNEDKGNSKATERYVVCNLGTRIIPYDVSHTLTITGTIITDDGQEGISCFDRSPLTTTTVVDINYVPPQVEIISVANLTVQDIIAISTSISTAVATDLATDFANLSNGQTAMQTIINEIAAKTVQMVFTKAGELDVNAKSQNSVTIAGAGISTDKWRGVG